jgi:predicted Fe-S protein YdhL (DUF1289 family)
MTDSPCVGICIMEGDFCIGCGRTAEEIYQAGVDAMQEELRPALTPIPTPAPK